MSLNISYLIVFCYSFLIGAVPFGFIIAKLKGVNITKEGSCNVGATNVWRCVGPKEGILTAVLDGCKGVFAIVITGLYFPYLVPLAMFSSVSGHIFSPALMFKGGKGVATFVATIALIDPLRASVFLTIWFTVIIVTRYVSLASLVGMCYIICSASYRLLVGGMDNVSGSIAISEICTAFLSIIMHSPNIGKLISGKENRLSFNKLNKINVVNKLNKRRL
ncbi:MAG: glycerol-3-phosphate acyltransferase [Alphaproteobacteria bacterium]|nr:glycerol-3-phosphate acyltransferase [Rickettsiales bacterium]